MPSFSTKTVTQVVSERPGLQRVLVDGQAAYVLTDLVGPVAVGDRVVVNTTAVDLGLGTGGSHVVHWNLSREEWTSLSGGLVMKLRYTSLQVDSGAAEEDLDFSPAPDLGAMPVVACDLHSQVAAVALAFKWAAPDRRLGYVMTDSAALPAALSDVAARLRADGTLSAIVTCGQAFGGDYEAVGIPSGLQVARTLAGTDAVVVGPGPGVVGTGSKYGFGGVEVATVVDMAAALGARPVLAVRYSGVDPRAGHRGVSHHTTTALSLASTHPLVPVPEGSAATGLGAVVVVQVPDEIEVALGGVESMGRRAAEDLGFLRHAAAAGIAAAALLR